MKFTTVTSAALTMALTALATPIEYPKGTGENLPYYPPPKGGWESVKYPPGTGAAAGAAAPVPCVGSGVKPSTFTFTSTYEVVATGSEVRNGTVSVPGPTDAVGFFNYGINSRDDTICYVSTTTFAT